MSALGKNLIPTSVRYVLLDLEHWPLTPVDEQRNPIAQLKKVLSVAHQHGKCVIFAPAVDLTTVVQPGTPGPMLFATFDRLVVQPGAAASDVFDIQSQQTEGSVYALSFAPGAIAAARTAHPGEPVFVGLSTNPDGRRVRGSDLLALYRAAANAGATGYWLNVPQTSAECPRCGIPQPRVALTFLEALAHKFGSAEPGVRR